MINNRKFTLATGTARSVVLGVRVMSPFFIFLSQIKSTVRHLSSRLTRSPISVNVGCPLLPSGLRYDSGAYAVRKKNKGHRARYMVAFWSLLRQPVLWQRHHHRLIPPSPPSKPSSVTRQGSLVPRTHRAVPIWPVAIARKGFKNGFRSLIVKDPLTLERLHTPTRVPHRSLSPGPPLPPLPSLQSVPISFTSLEVYFWRIQVESLPTPNHETTVYFYLLTVPGGEGGLRRKKGVEGGVVPLLFLWLEKKKISATCFVFKKSSCHTVESSFTLTFQRGVEPHS